MTVAWILNPSCGNLLNPEETCDDDDDVILHDVESEV